LVNAAYPGAVANGGGALLFQSTPLVAAVAELGSLADITRMGNTYTNFTICGPSQQEVAKTLVGRSAIVTPAARGCVVVFDEQSDELLQAAVPALALQWSEAFACPVLGVVNYDDDILWYRLYIRGEKVDEYASWIGIAGRLRIPRGGDATKLCDAFGSSNVSEVESVLRKPSEGDGSYRFAVDRHADLARALGIPSFGVGAGYGYIGDGDLPDGLHPDDLVKVTSSCRLTMRCSEPGGSVAVAIRASRAPGR